MATRAKAEYWCVAVRRNYEAIWRVIGKYDTREAAEAAVAEKRAYVGTFNYDNAEFRIISRAEAKKEFGPKWEYFEIGQKPGTPVRKPPKPVKDNDF